MRVLRTEVSIQASPAVIWRILTDFAAFPHWNPFIRRITGEALVGQRLTVQLTPPNQGGVTFQPRVKEVEPERAFAWRGQLALPGLFDGEHRFELEPGSGGRTRFLHWERFSGLLVPLMWGRVAPNTRAGFDAMNEALRDRAEAMHAGETA